MNYLAWNRPPSLPALARAVAQHAKPLHLIVCLPDNALPVFGPSETPSPQESALSQAIEGKLGCIQFNAANALYDILPGVHLWLMPSETARRLGEHFPQPVQWQTEAVPQLPPSDVKPWFKPPEHRTATRAIVIGAGIAGAATARALAQHGLPVTVLEAAEPAN
uniref:FAD-dependent oxidoreductase n=1 Tax=Neisseria dentiae TaxID=194197 RepID=UPI00359F84A9